jgi:hypothetical protein
MLLATSRSTSSVFARARRGGGMLTVSALVGLARHAGEGATEGARGKSLAGLEEDPPSLHRALATVDQLPAGQLTSAQNPGASNVAWVCSPGLPRRSSFVDGNSILFSPVKTNPVTNARSTPRSAVTIENGRPQPDARRAGSRLHREAANDQLSHRCRRARPIDLLDDATGWLHGAVVSPRAEAPWRRGDGAGRGLRRRPRQGVNWTARVKLPPVPLTPST